MIACYPQWRLSLAQIRNQTSWISSAGLSKVQEGNMGQCPGWQAKGKKKEDGGKERKNCEMIYHEN